MRRTRRFPYEDTAGNDGALNLDHVTHYWVDENGVVTIFFVNGQSLSLPKNEGEGFEGAFEEWARACA